MSTALRTKPEKPRPDFPLFAHAAGVWAKKIRGKLHYFGPWSDPDAALKKYLDEKDDLQAGRKPRAKRDGLPLRDALNRFLTAKKNKADAGELSLRQLRELRQTGARLIEAFGKVRLVEDLDSEDFEHLRTRLAMTRGPVALGNEIQRVRSIFKYCYEAGLIEKPVRFGPEFVKPSKKVMRQVRQAKGPRMFEAAELRKIIANAETALKAMVLLACNCGFGQSDIAALPTRAIDLKHGWVDFPRPKTAIERRCPLWKETIAALREALEHRPEAAEPNDACLAFLTYFGNRWVRVKVTETKDGPKYTPVDSVHLEFEKLLARLKMKRKGIAFYSIRRTFRTIADEAQDEPAVTFLMGHAPPENDMGAVYRQRIADARLKTVTDHVHRWLFTGRRTRK